MKKLLLFSTLCMAALAANADYSDYFKVYYEGKPVTDGETIVCSDYIDNSIIGFGFNYDANINFVNEIESSIPVYVDIEYTGMPTLEDANGDRTFWGYPQVCYGNMNDAGDVTGGSCVDAPAVAMLPAAPTSNFYWQAHLQMVSENAVSKYKFVFYPCDGDGTHEGEYEPIYDEGINIYVVFAPTHEAGVNDIASDANAAIEYYNLQGVRVENPSNGLYIVRQGKKVSKTIIRN